MSSQDSNAPTGQPPGASTPPGGTADATAAAAAAAQDAVNRGLTQDQARELIDARLASANLRLTDDDCSRIADAMIERMDQRGAFEDHQPSGAAAGPSADANPAGTAGGATNNHGEPVAPPPGTPAPPPAPDVAPRKKTFAERFVGRA